MDSRLMGLHWCRQVIGIFYHLYPPGTTGFSHKNVTKRLHFLCYQTTGVLLVLKVTQKKVSAISDTKEATDLLYKINRHNHTSQ